MIALTEQIRHRALSVAHSILHPRRYFLAAFFISIGGFLNGFDTGSIGAITLMPTFQTRIAFLTPAMRGLTVSILLLAGTFPSLVAGLLADRYGHLAIVLAGAIFFTVGAALEAGSVNLAMLLIGRSLVGVGEGLYLGNLNVYICEIAPKARRGMFVALPQLLVTAGVCAGYFTCYATIRMPDEMQWRLPFIIQAGLGAMLALVCCLLPESPRWLLTRADIRTAMRNVQRLDLAENEIMIDSSAGLTDVDRSPAYTRSQIPKPFSRDAILDLFRKEYRLRTLLALFILGMVQLCGIDGVLFYAPTLFAQAGLSNDTASFVASGVTGILIFAITIPAFLTVDKFGRRTVVITGGLTLAFCMLVVGSLYASHSVHQDHGAGRWTVIVLIIAFALSYAATWGIVGKTYASEIQPARNRATANAMAQALNFFTNFLAAFMTPIFLTKSSSGPYFLFAGLTIITLAVLWIWMPETRARSLESIELTFISPGENVWRNATSNLRRRMHRSSVATA